MRLARAFGAALLSLKISPATVVNTSVTALEMVKAREGYGHIPENCHFTHYQFSKMLPSFLLTHLLLFSQVLL